MSFLISLGLGGNMIIERFNFKGWKTTREVPDFCRDQKWCRIMVDAPLDYIAQPSEAVSRDIAGRIIEFRWNEQTHYFECL